MFLMRVLLSLLNSEIIGLNIPTSVPLVYEFDHLLKPIKHYYLADPEELKKKMEAVQN